MDVIAGIRQDVKKIILDNICHGLLVFMPFVLAAIKLAESKKMDAITIELIKDFSTAIIFSFIVLCFALGHLFLKMGHRLEEGMERHIYPEKKMHDQFYKTFYQYLNTFFPKDSEPVLIRYYSNMVLGLRFELALIFSLTSSYVIAEIIDHWFIGIIPHYMHCPIFMGWFFLVLYIYYEARTGIETLHGYRMQIIDSFKIINRDFSHRVHDSLYEIVE